MSYLDDEYDAAYEADVMGGSAQSLEKAVIGRRIVKVEYADPPRNGYGYSKATVLTLDDGTRVYVSDTDDCCAFTSVEDFSFLENVENVVTSVVTDANFTRWFVYAAGVPVVSLDVAWSPGNPYYYGFGFNIVVEPYREDQK